MTYLKSYLLFFVLQRNKKKEKETKKIHVLHDVLNTYLKLNIAIIHQTVTNKNKESSPAKPVIHFQCSRQKTLLRNKTLCVAGLQFPRPR